MPKDKVDNTQEEVDDAHKPSKKALAFGTMMILIYFAMAYALVATEFFAITIQYDWVRYVCGAVFAIYGIWRGYRLFSA